MPKHEPFIIDGVTYERDSAPGEGGSAVVWKARRKPDGQVFAVKRIKKDRDADSARNKRLPPDDPRLLRGGSRICQRHAVERAEGTARRVRAHG